MKARHQSWPAYCWRENRRLITRCRGALLRSRLSKLRSAIRPSALRFAGRDTRKRGDGIRRAHRWATLAEAVENISCCGRRRNTVFGATFAASLGGGLYKKLCCALSSGSISCSSSASSHRRPHNENLAGSKASTSSRRPRFCIAWPAAVRIVGVPATTRRAAIGMAGKGRHSRLAGLCRRRGAKMNMAGSFRRGARCFETAGSGDALVASWRAPHRRASRHLRTSSLDSIIGEVRPTSADAQQLLSRDDGIGCDGAARRHSLNAVALFVFPVVDGHSRPAHDNRPVFCGEKYRK